MESTERSSNLVDAAIKTSFLKSTFRMLFSPHGDITGIHTVKFDLEQNALIEPSSEQDP
jgi:hypothetical protein